MQTVVALSGGKDSVAMALRLREIEPDSNFEYLITPTGNELPEMEGHWDRLEKLLGQPLIRLKAFAGDGLKALIEREQMIPNFRARFCTRVLKIEPTVDWLKQHAPVSYCLGLRADEPERLGLYGELKGVHVRYPLREWGWRLQEVLVYLAKRKVIIPERTDCAWCFFQRLVEWKRLWQHHPEYYTAASGIERQIGATFRSPQRDTWPADLDALGITFAQGKPVRGEGDWRQLTLFNCDRDELCRVCSM